MQHAVLVSGLEKPSPDYKYFWYFSGGMGCVIVRCAERSAVCGVEKYNPAGPHIVAMESGSKASYRTTRLHAPTCTKRSSKPRGLCKDTRHHYNA